MNKSNKVIFFNDTKECIEEMIPATNTNGTTYEAAIPSAVDSNVTRYMFTNTCIGDELSGDGYRPPYKE